MKSQTKFTPGPWALYDRNKDDQWIESLAEKVEGNIICNAPEAEFTASLDSWPANVALIAQAPAMYTAMQSFVEDFEMDYVMDDGRIVDSPREILVVNYNIFKSILSAARGEE